METHPEEFYYKPNEGVGKWTRLLDTFKRSLTKEEIDAVDEGLRKIERERFTELVMQTLVGVEDETSDEKKSYTNSMGGLTLTADPSASSGLAWSNSSVTDADTYLKAQQAQMEQLKIQMDWLKREESLMKVEVKKKAVLR
jgi:hypothetical protein